MQLRDNTKFREFAHQRNSLIEHHACKIMKDSQDKTMEGKEGGMEGGKNPSILLNNVIQDRRNKGPISFLHTYFC